MYLNLTGSWRSSGCSVLRLEIVFLECLLDTTMGVFHGYQIALELSSFVPLKKKQELRKLITSNDGVVSFIVTKKVNDSDYFLTRLSSISWLCLALILEQTAMQPAQWASCPSSAFLPVVEDRGLVFVRSRAPLRSFLNRCYINLHLLYDIYYLFICVLFNCISQATDELLVSFSWKWCSCKDAAVL